MRLIKIKNKIEQKFEKYGYHYFFVISLILLVLISIWWTVFINSSIEKLRAEKYKNLKKTLEYYALEICSYSNTSPKIGEFLKDKRFEIKRKSELNNEIQVPLCLKWNELILALKQTEFSEIERDYKSKKLMVSGESAVFLFVILISILYLYAFVKKEKRTTIEIREFFERITHEIKTPITGIKALLQSIKSGTINDKDLIIYTDLALKQINRQEKLSENILAGAYLKSKDKVPELEIINIENFIKKYFDTYSYLKSEIEISIIFLSNKNIEVYGDTYYLKVILDNLVDNAIKYSSEDLKLEVVLEESDTEVTIIIKDNGTGIDTETIEILFEAYRSTKSGSARKSQGSGIGLSISKDMSRKMGSDLKFRNRVGLKGAEFYLSLKKNEI